jgi:hypothetical protein
MLLLMANDMRALFLRLVMVFSVLLAGLHIPASAQQIDLADHHDSHAVETHNMAGEHHDMPVDSDCDFLHHHHCPVGLASNSSLDLASLLIREPRLVPLTFASLHSRATAPPLKPPSA